ncbi:MAG: hypothetical protein ACI9LV_000638 [Candidatus Nanohaloarchaea archaeon]|jgi:hypothetical protein
MTLKERYLTPKVRKTFEGVERDFEDENIEIGYNVDSGEYELEARLNGDGELTAEVRYHTENDYNRGTVSIAVKNEEETLVEDSQSFYIDEIAAPEGRDVMAFKNRNHGRSLRDALGDTMELANQFTNSEEFFRYRDIAANSYIMENENGATRDLIEVKESDLTGNLAPLPTPLEKLGRSYTSNIGIRKNDEELRNNINDSQEAEKWKELGEDILEGEKSIESVEEIIGNLENSRRGITDIQL